jgi:cytochrome P450
MTEIKTVPGPSVKEFNKQRLMLKNPMKLFKKYDDDFPGIFQVNIFNNSFIHISDPDLIQEVLQKNQKIFVKNDDYQALVPVFGNGLVTSSNELWKKQRKMIQPSFHKKTINGFFDTMVQSTLQMFDEWDEQLKSNNVIDFQYEMSSVTLQIIGLTMLSTDVKKEKDKVNHALMNSGKYISKKTMETFKVPMWIPTETNKNLINTRNALDEIILPIIDERKKIGNIKDDMLDMLMLSRYEDNGEKMPVQLLRDEIITIFMAGHETTSSALTWTFHYLSQNPKAYTTLKQEIDTVLQGEELKFEHLKQLKYTKACVNESMRLMPPVWAVGKKSTESTMIGPYKIKKNTNIIITNFLSHRNPKYWDKPNEFLPERWKTEEVKKNHKFAFFPFGGGPRMCIGNNMALLEAEVLLTKIVQKYSFEYVGEKAPQVIAQITTSAKYGMPMKVKKLS